MNFTPFLELGADGQYSFPLFSPGVSNVKNDAKSPSCWQQPQAPPPLPFSGSPIVTHHHKTNNLDHQDDFPNKANLRRKRQPWSDQEDRLLLELVQNEGHYKPNWPQLADRVNACMGTIRTGKQCRERWQNHLRPNIKKGNWTIEEEEMIRNLYKTFGPKWSCMSKLMKNRTDNDIKNKWNSMCRTEKLIKSRYGNACSSMRNPEPLTQPNITSDKNAGVPIHPPADFFAEPSGMYYAPFYQVDECPNLIVQHQDGPRRHTDDSQTNQNEHATSLCKNFREV